MLCYSVLGLQTIRFVRHLRSNRSQFINFHTSSSSKGVPVVRKLVFPIFRKTIGITLTSAVRGLFKLSKLPVKALSSAPVSQFSMKHSEPSSVEYSNLKIMTLPALEDNFMYLLMDKSSRKALAVDPVEPNLVLETVARENFDLVGVLTTHHHWDHSGGNEELVGKIKQNGNNGLKFEVYGGDDRVPALTTKVENGQQIELGSLNIQCIATPCHTSGHICYYVVSEDIDKQKPAVFTGDTLFIGGCGRFFEGTADQMNKALNEKLGNLPAETQVFCGHEYTTKNLMFALSVEPDNQKTKKKLELVKILRSQKMPSVPSTILEEKETNPFMRVQVAEIQNKYNVKNTIECMSILRNMKDKF